MNGISFEEVLKRLEGLDENALRQLKSEAYAATKQAEWVPNPGPQTDAAMCAADELFYGGQAGGGKSSLITGLAVTEHQRSLILRRYRKDAEKMAEEQLLGKILGSRDGWNGQQLSWKRNDQLIEFGGCEMEADKQKYKGIAHDLICFDEISDFAKSQYQFITIWNRSTKPGQRCRVICTGNPPTSADGLWVIQHWAPWLDPAYPNPAEPGELRWFITDDDGNEREVDGVGPHGYAPNGDPIYAKSRTFIPAQLKDNPDLYENGEYSRNLNAMPKELRDAYRDGKFNVSLKDQPNQCIPTEWISAAQQRWTAQPPVGLVMNAIGVDVAQGGQDKTVICCRYDAWFDKLVIVPGEETKGGSEVAGLVIANRLDNAKVIIDVGGGWGADAYGKLISNGIDPVPYMGVKSSHGRAQGGMMKFFNVRTEAYWKLREALNPDQPGGSMVCLPPGQIILSDLSAPTYSLIAGSNSAGGTLKLESKEDIKKRLGRSPDAGDAIVMAWYDGVRQENVRGGYTYHKRKGPPKVNLGHQNMKRR